MFGSLGSQGWFSLIKWRLFSWLRRRLRFWYLAVNGSGFNTKIFVFTARDVQGHQIDCDLSLNLGNVALAYGAIEWYLEIWDTEKCQQVLHSDKFVAGLFMRESSTVWVAKLVSGLLNYCLNQAVAHLMTQSKVVRVENSKKIILETCRVILAKQAIVHASNANMVEYLEFLRDKVIPKRGQCSRLKPTETKFWSFGLSASDERECYQQSPIDARITMIRKSMHWFTKNRKDCSRNGIRGLSQKIRQSRLNNHGLYSRWTTHHWFITGRSTTVSPVRLQRLDSFNRYFREQVDLFSLSL